MTNCVHAAGWQWAVKREEEGRREKRGEEEQAGKRKGPFGGASRAWRAPVDAAEAGNSPFALERRMRE
jgi:hypothetical protein